MKLSSHTPPHQRRELPFKLLALSAALAMLNGAAYAQSDESYWTMGIGAGQTRAVFDELDLTNRNSNTLPGNAPTGLNIATDRRDAGGKVFLGRQFNKYVGMEVGYFNLGKFGWQTNTTPAGTLTGEVRAQGLNVDLLGTLPLTTNLSALARVGATYARTRSNYSSSGVINVINSNPSDRKTEPKVGLGLQYAFANNFQMRAEGEEYRISDALGGRGKVRMYSVSLVIPFGRAAPAAMRSAYVAPMAEPAPQPRAEPMVMAPPPPAPAPAPAPVVVTQAPPAPPAPVPLRRVQYGAESMFEFAASAVRPDGKVALDTFTTELAGTKYDKITVEGHTDRLGSTEFNQALSVQRAEAVKEYLVQVRGVPADKVTAVGVGEGKPTTKPEDCKGTAQTAKLKACLQPDRRVEIEVSGTR